MRERELGLEARGHAQAAHQVGLAGRGFEQRQLGEGQLAAGWPVRGSNRLDHALVDLRHMLDARLVMHAGVAQGRVGLTERVGLIESGERSGAGTGHRARGYGTRRGRGYGGMRRGKVHASAASLGRRRAEQRRRHEGSNRRRSCRRKHFHLAFLHCLPTAPPTVARKHSSAQDLRCSARNMSHRRARAFTGEAGGTALSSAVSKRRVPRRNSGGLKPARRCAGGLPGHSRAPRCDTGGLAVRTAGALRSMRANQGRATEIGACRWCVHAKTRIMGLMR